MARLLWPGLLVLTLACAHPGEPKPPPPASAVAPVQAVAPVEPEPAITGPEAEARASEAFHRLEPAFEASQAIPFDVPKRLKAALTTRLKALSQLEAGYQAVIKLGALEWSVAGLVRLGQAYEGLAQAFRGAAAPAGLSAEQLELFRSELAGRAVPLERKAVASYQKAIALEEQAAAQSDWGGFARERLTWLVRPADER